VRFRHCPSMCIPNPDQILFEVLILHVQLIPAPRGTGLVASPAVKRLLQLAGVQDAYTSSSGSTMTLETTLKATFIAVGNTYGFLTPNLWKETKLIRSPLEEFGDVLREGKRY
jgi:small subunit ribosomal protein S2e